MDELKTLDSFTNDEDFDSSPPPTFAVSLKTTQLHDRLARAHRYVAGSGTARLDTLDWENWGDWSKVSPPWLQFPDHS